MILSGDASRATDGTAATRHLTLPLEGGDLHVCQDGPRDAPALLLVHGSASSARSWDPLVPLLTRAHHVVRVDLLGHGRSAKPDGPGYGIPEQAHRAGEVLDRLGLRRAVVVGHSTGGSVATALAEQRPGLVSALALLNSGPYLDAFIGGDVVPIEPEQWPELTDEQILRAMAPAFSRPGFRIPHDLVDDVRGMTYHSFVSTLRSSAAYLEERPLPDRLTGLRTPLLVLFGADDRRWGSASAEAYRAVPDARVELLPGLGHSPMMEDPERTATPLLDFTARHRES
ncbi:alpha/beta fold hydrolase [Streptomyces sp. NPDC048172]|uniref:alpha/beta fold hydrolase n=1 Tax=Streptomyces sp. NPDC048172 TaxID=3365505 RepID=UPI00371315F3